MRANVNVGLLLKNICEYTKVGVKIECSWHYASRGGAPPQYIILKADLGMIIGGQGLDKFLQNGYRFQNCKADSTGLIINLERRYV